MANKTYFLKDSIDFDGNAYEGDLIGNRKEFGDNLKKIIDTIGDGAVISIDAPWGDGKTTFLRWWSKDLENDNYPITIFDAFKHDFQDDAFIAVFSHLIKVFKEIETSDKYEEEMQERIKTGLELIVKSGVKAATKYIPIAGEAVESIIKQLIAEEKVTRHDELEKFKEELDNLTSKLFLDKHKPLVFIIDELDRCRPLFAVELLEKIKHFFSVAGIIWVIALNKMQLAEAIKHVYGCSEPHWYLEKFFNIELIMPLSDIYSSIANRRNEALRKLIFKNYPQGLNGNDYLISLYNNYQMSLRDVEKQLQQFSLLSTEKNNELFEILLQIIKMKKPVLYLAIKDGKYSEPENKAQFAFLEKDNNQFGNDLLNQLYFTQFLDENIICNKCDEILADRILEEKSVRNESLKNYVEQYRGNGYRALIRFPSYFKRIIHKLDCFSL